MTLTLVTAADHYRKAVELIDDRTYRTNEELAINAQLAQVQASLALVALVSEISKAVLP